MSRALAAIGSGVAATVVVAGIFLYIGWVASLDPRPLDWVPVVQVALVFGPLVGIGVGVTKWFAP